MHLTRRLTNLACASIFFFASLIANAGDLKAQAQIVAIDNVFPNDRAHELSNYLANVTIDKDTQIFTVEFEGFNIFRIKSANTCLKDRCMTVVARRCGEPVCEHLNLLAEAYVYSNPLYIDIFGGLRSIVFGRLGYPGVVLLFGKSQLITTTVP